jgi:hypothetical protein
VKPPGGPDEGQAGEAQPAEAPVPELETMAGSVLLAWAHERLVDGAPGFYDRLAGAGLVPERERRAPRPELRVYVARQQSALLEAAWRKTGAILQALDEECTAAGARLLVVYVPSRMEVHDDAWDLVERTYRLRPGQWARDAVVRRLERLAREAGYPVLDLTPALRAADRGLLGRPYFAHDGHWTAIGHEAAAQALQAELGRLGLLPPAATSP